MPAHAQRMSSLLVADKEVAPCRVERRAYGAGRGVRAGRREAAGDCGACSVQGRARLQIGSRARGEAHVEHVAHVCDAGCVEAQQLVEHRRAVEHADHACDAGGVEAQRLVERPRVEEHVAHVCDAGCVEAQRLVERLRVLSRVERRAYGAGRRAGWKAGGRQATAGHAACRGGLECKLGAGHGEERTLNINRMSVTLEVLKLTGWLNAAASRNM